MKRILLTCFLITSGILANAQRQDSLYDATSLYRVESDTAKSLPKVDVDPAFPGGPAGFFKFFQRNVRFPEELRNQAIRGNVYVAFIVEKDGRLTDIRIVKGLCESADKEAFRIMKLSPKWKPAKVSGQICRANYTMSLFFGYGGNAN